MLPQDNMEDIRYAVSAAYHLVMKNDYKDLKDFYTTLIRCACQLSNYGSLKEFIADMASAFQIIDDALVEVKSNLPDIYITYSGEVHAIVYFVRSTRLEKGGMVSVEDIYML